MPGSLDLAGMLAALEGRRPPAPRHPLDELTLAGHRARAGLRAFGPERVEPDPARPAPARPRPHGD
ncbi:hypothetical protein SK069_13075 [Patulibacter brassicae]|uniref:Uncharacterized protein n=1 Tax=Patulibacter brassicae TaxID=1705717 RepID=A0ABU4VL18_9ACTN|nr:hypothetical protein [Patulibacter brassicae]MDX8152532.1 hypothetical protein [Patulibacter brassicae]